MRLIKIVQQISFQGGVIPFPLHTIQERFGVIFAIRKTETNKS